MTVLLAALAAVLVGTVLQRVSGTGVGLVVGGRDVVDSGGGA